MWPRKKSCGGILPAWAHGRDLDGEYFDLRHRPALTPELLDVQPGSRQLVLMVRKGREENKFLLGTTSGTGS